MTASDNDPTPLKRISKGRKPQYFTDPATDKLLSMVLILTQELSVARDRIDTLERLIEAAGLFPAAKVDSYLPTADEAAERAERRASMLSRVFRSTEREIGEINGQSNEVTPDDFMHILS